MTLLNKKANQNDRISDLPSNVIDGILGNMKVRDQVRTSILSTKWRYMWTSAPHFCFDDDFYQRFMDLNDPYPVMYKTITNVLMLHNGPIHKFSIYVSRHYEFNISMENLNKWIPFMSRDIKHLELVTHGPEKDQMPGILFSCKELTYFKVSSFNLSIPPNFCSFKKLLELHLESCDEIESSALESFMSGCPILEKLTIGLCCGCDHLVISSPSLKVLVLRWIDTKSICLKKANNLIDFTLTTYAGRGFTKSLPKIKRFSFAKWRKIPFPDIIPPTLLTSSFSSLEYLKVDYLNSNDKREMLYFVSVLKSAPKLIELDIKVNMNTYVS
ncbi:unnamed protein product [Lathyrus sativus]|nr:unnamed protein product [Lathyrus sativus]